MSKTDWIEFDLKTGELCCQRCGERYQIAMPIAIKLLVAKGDGFAKMHSMCKEKEPTK